STNKKAEILVETKIKKNQDVIKNYRQSIWFPILAVVCVIVLMLCVYLFIKLPKAEITIWPKIETLSFQKTITADKSSTIVDSGNMVIPAQYFEATKTNSQDFPATGSATNDGKASGTITVYNKCDPATPLTLSKGAHFLSDSGKSFSYLKKIIIPAATKKSGKTTPGSIQLKVEADESGTSYNIAPAAFSIPKLNGTIYYSCIYATSDDAMIGGYTGNVKKVTEDDISGAKDVLTKKTSLDAMADLKAQISDDYILIDKAVSTDIVSALTKTKSGTIADNFNYEVKITASALVFKKSDLEQLAKNYIISQLSDGKTILDSNFKIDYSANVIDISSGKMTLNLDFSSGIYQDIDKNSVSLSLLGENESQISQTLNSRLGGTVVKIETKFWPFWVTKVPNNQGVVNVKLEFGE
ncbi:MAG: hypothetical protein WCK10_03375, partial [Candidatus Staskawiczbacteria bacterium]